MPAETGARQLNSVPAVGHCGSEGIQHVRLREHSRSDMLTVPVSARDALFEIAQDRVRLLAAPDPTKLIIESTGWVGSIIVPGLLISIEPAIGVHSLLALLAGADDELAWGKQDSSYGLDDDLSDGAARVMLRAMDAATRRGLLHGYRTRTEQLSVIRGRLLIAELAKRPWEVAQPPCEYDDFTADVAENRRLRCALTWLLRTPGLSALTRRHAMELLTRFDDVAETAASEHPTPVTITRLNEHYAAALGLADLVLAGSSISHERGEARAHAFLLNTEEVFARFVTHQLRQRLWPQLSVDAQAQWGIDAAGSLDARADAIVSADNRPRLVLSTLYRVSAVRSRNPHPGVGTGDLLRSRGGFTQPYPGVTHLAGLASDAADFFPAMVQAASLNVTNALVVYAHAEHRPASRIRMPGTAINVHSWHLDVNQPGPQLEEALEALAQFALTLT